MKSPALARCYQTNLAILSFLFILAQTRCDCQNTNDSCHAISGFRIDLENDRFSGSILNTDRNYTQGAGIALSSTKIARWLTEEYTNSRELEHFAPVEFVAQFGAFTPDHIEEIDPIIGDRPYSTIFLLGAKVHKVNVSKQSVISFGLYTGALGIDGPAKNLQTSIHKGMNDGNTHEPYNPQGWHNQISNGGEPTRLFTYNQLHLLTKKGIQKEITNQIKSRRWTKLQIAGYHGFSFGYLTQSHAGVNLRFGKLDLEKFASDLFNAMNIVSQIESDPNVEKIRQYFGKKSILEVYLFVSVTAIHSYYNGSLHGQFRRTAYRLDYLETGFMTAQARVGIGIAHNNFSFASYLAFKAPEMWNYYSRVHSWGGVSLGFYW